MANTAEIAGGRPGRRWRPAPAEVIPPPGAIGAPTPVLEIDNPGAIILTRNEVMREALGGRTWRGALVNATGRPYDEVMVRIHFHDREGRSVGSPVTARAARLGPGAALHMQARLPAAAAGMRVHSLRWTVGGEVVAPGPFGPWAFGGARI